jgi:hypothetical protein
MIFMPTFGYGFAAEKGPEKLFLVKDLTPGLQLRPLSTSDDSRSWAHKALVSLVIGIYAGEKFPVKTFQFPRKEPKRILITLLLSQQLEHDHHRRKDLGTPPREAPSSHYCLIKFDYYQPRNV